jgi:hypothetical protein
MWMSTLWPQATVHDGWRRREQRFLAMPGSAAPTQVLPASLASVVASAGRPSDDRPRLRQLRDGVGVAALLAAAPVRSGRRMSVSRDGEDLAGLVRRELGLVSGTTLIMCGPPRANQKPILQLLDRRARTIGYVKVAWNDLTRQLLDDEARTLRQLDGGVAGAFRAPVLLGAGDFADGTWLAMGPVGVDRRRPATAPDIDALAVAIENTARRTETTVARSPFIERLRRSAVDLPRAQPIVERLIQQYGDAQLALAACHGDFVPWNILSGTPVAAVWDWERYEPQVPVGFDRLHHRVQLAIQRRGRTVEDTVNDLHAHVDQVLPELEASQRRAHLDFYLAEVLCRYEHDLMINPAERLGQRVSALTASFRQRGE